MAGKDFQFQRHLKLWEEQNKLIKRSVLLALIFSAFVVVKILIPTSNLDQKKLEDNPEIKQLKEKKAELVKTNQQLIELDKTFSDVQETIKKAPWTKEKDKLVSTFRNMRERGDYPAQREIQDTANVTIRRIANQFRGEIIKPLSEKMDKLDKSSEELNQLSEKIENIEKSVDQWEQNYVDRVWYGTIESKSMTTRDFNRRFEEKVSDSMQDFESIREAVSQQRANLDAELQKSTEQINDIAQQIKQQEEKLLASINEALKQVLPSWFNYLFKVEKTIQIFPVILIILLVLELYVIYLGIMLSRHYRFIAKNVKFSETERQDLSTSSLWTLTERGKFGNSVTRLAYILFTLTLWALFEWSYFLLIKLRLSEIYLDWDIGFIGHELFLWICRAIFLAIILIFTFKPLMLNKIFSE